MIGQGERVRNWLARLARLFTAGSTDGDSGRSVEDIILGGPRHHTRAEFVDKTGMDPELAARLWRSLGLTELADEDALVLTEDDWDALVQFEQLRAVGSLPAEVREAAARTVGQTMATLADWEVELLHQLVVTSAPADEVDEEQILDSAEQILPLLERTQNFVWRRHLAAAAARLVAVPHEDPATRTLSVGFADMVDFTWTTRHVSLTQFTHLIDEFQEVAAELVTSQDGRVVKTIGDEVLFVTEHPINGAEIALGLMERLAEVDLMPQLRIGMAFGPVVPRYGDVYGEVVNIAARLTAHAKPGQILVDRDTAAALELKDGYQVGDRRKLRVHGYPRLQSCDLSRAE